MHRMPHPSAAVLNFVDSCSMYPPLSSSSSSLLSSSSDVIAKSSSAWRWKYLICLFSAFDQSSLWQTSSDRTVHDASTPWYHHHYRHHQQQQQLSSLLSFLVNKPHLNLTSVNWNQVTKQTVLFGSGSLGLPQTRSSPANWQMEPKRSDSSQQQYVCAHMSRIFTWMFKRLV